MASRGELFPVQQPRIASAGTDNRGEVELVFLACHDAWSLLKASGNASIINFASVNSFCVPDDVAWCAVWLASDEGRRVTGANFAIDGGVTAV